MGILNVDTIKPVGGGTTITLSTSEINVGAGITFESNGQAIYSGIITATSFSGAVSGSTGTFTGDVDIADKIIHTGDTNTAIRFPAADTITAETAGSERLRIDSSGRVMIGTTTEGLATYGEDLTIGSSDHAGITLRTGTGHKGTVYFSDGTSGDAEYKGSIQYDHSDNSLRLATNSSVRFLIGSAGQFGIGGATYGSSGQVLTSQGASSAVQWATPAAGWVHGTETALNGNVVLIKNGVPDGASHIRYLLRYVSTNSTAQPFCQVELNNNGTIKNSNFQTASTTTRNGSPQISGDSDKTDGLTLWNGYTNAGNILHGVLNIYRIGTNGSDGTNYYMEFHGMGNSSSSGYDATHSGQGYFELGTGSTDYVSGLRLSTGNGSVQFDNGYVQQSYLLS